MAGDWIKMRGNLWDDPRVGALVDATDSSEATVIGGLYWLWASADQHTEDGFMPGLSLRQIDRKTGIKGFGQAVASIGWIEECEEGIRIVRFDEHNGASAKKRCQTAKRVAKHKAGDDAVTPKDETGNAVNVTQALPRDREEKEQEQEPTGNTLAPKDSPAPVPTEVREGQQPTAAGIPCRLLREAGFGATNPSHPHLLRALDHGVTPEAIRDCALEAKDLGKSSPIQWAYATALSRHQEPERPRPAARAGPGVVEQPMGKQMQGLMALEARKRELANRMAGNGNLDGPAKAGLPFLGQDAGG